jgi:signal transduction histidine kinase
VDIGLSTIEANGRKLRVAFVADITQRRQLERAAQAHAEQVQALAARLLTAQEEERRRVSRELHDQICQQLASLAIEISGMAADPPPPEKAHQVLRELQTRVIQASEATRHIAYELHPSVLDDLGLVASLRALCKKFGEDEGVRVQFSSGVLPPEIPRETASCLYRVVQESLQNIARHAGAKKASVSLSVKKNAVALSITDDGSGFDLEEARGRGGLGLIGMEERTRLAKGKLSIAAAKGRGTRIQVEVPLKAGVA